MVPHSTWAVLRVEWWKSRGGGGTELKPRKEYDTSLARSSGGDITLTGNDSNLRAKVRVTVMVE